MRTAAAKQKPFDKLQKPLLGCYGSFFTEIFITKACGLPAARRPVKKALLNQKGFINVFKCIFFFIKSSRQSIEPHRPALEFVDYGEEKFAVHMIESFLINLQPFHRADDEIQSDRSVSFDLGKIAHSAEEPISNTRGTPRAPRYFCGRRIINYCLK